MSNNDRMHGLFQDARELQADALEMLARDQVRDAAEKAWGATKRATDALILARTGAEPERTTETGVGLGMLAHLDEAVRDARLQGRYYTRQGQLHGECFYNGLCDPLDETERRIRETSDYIKDAERLAVAEAHRSEDISPTSSGLSLEPDAEPDTTRLQALLQADDRFRRAWEQGQTSLSESAHELALADIAIRDGWPDQEVVNLMICWRRLHGRDLKLRESRYQLVLSRAKDPEMGFAKEQLDEILLLPPENSEEALRDVLTVLLGIDIIQGVRDGGDKPRYHLHTEQGNVELGPMANVTGRKRCTDRIGDITKVVPPFVSLAQWRNYAQAIVSLCSKNEAVGDGRASDEKAQQSSSMLTTLTAYLADRGVRDGMRCESEDESYQPFVNGKKRCITTHDLAAWLGINRGEQPDKEYLWRQLKLVGAESGTENIYIGVGRTSRGVWILPEDFQPPQPQDEPGGDEGDEQGE